MLLFVAMSSRSLAPRASFSLVNGLRYERGEITSATVLGVLSVNVGGCVGWSISVRHLPGIEVYSRARFIALTGNVSLPGAGELVPLVAPMD